MKSNVNSEADLLALARRLDSQALAEIYDRYSPDLYRYAMRLLGHPTNAEDCVAETFQRFLHALTSGFGPREHLRAYLYRVAHNWITDQYRRNVPESEIDDQWAEPGQGPEASAEQNIAHAGLRAALHHLTPDQRQVVALKFWEGWENEEIARTLGKPVGAVKSLQHRALAAIERHLEKELS
jgi:RNA polymerase sigma-70 factor (ECF subfamily)